MPRRTTEFAPRQYYHIYNRGVGSQPIFREEENYLYLLRLVKEYARELQVAVIAYCLMPNHYHFLLRQDGEDSAGLLLQLTFNAMAQNSPCYPSVDCTLFRLSKKRRRLPRFC